MVFKLIVYISALAGCLHLIRTRARRIARNRALVDAYCHEVHQAFNLALRDKAAASAVAVYTLLDDPPEPLAALRIEIDEEMEQLEDALKQCSRWTDESADPTEEQRRINDSLRNLLVVCSKALEPHVSQHRT